MRSGDYMDDKKIMEIIKEIVIKRGNNVEVRKGKDGALVVSEVKKHIVSV